MNYNKYGGSLEMDVPYTISQEDMYMFNLAVNVVRQAYVDSRTLTGMGHYDHPKEFQKWKEKEVRNEAKAFLIDVEYREGNLWRQVIETCVPGCSIAQVLKWIRRVKRPLKGCIEL